jgi:hypothetical protein
MNIANTSNESIVKYSKPNSKSAMNNSSVIHHNSSIMSNDCLRQSVFDRLYQDSRKKTTKKCV